MKTEKVFLLALALLCGLLLRTNAQTTSKDPLTGTWTNASQDRQFTFSPAGSNTYTATVSWLKPGTPGEAKLNQVIIKNLKAGKKPGEYTDGQLYLPKRDQWVKCSAKLTNPQTLELKGSLGFMSQTQTWTRAAAK